MSLISEELQKFRDAAIQQFIFNCTVRAQQSALASPISRDEIEYPAKNIVVDSFVENLKNTQTNMNGMRGKKYTFREVIEEAAAIQVNECSPGTKITRRSRSLSCGPLPLTSTPTTSRANSENPAKKVRTADDTAETLDESNASSHDGELIIDLDDTPSPAVTPKAEPRTPRTNEAASKAPGKNKPSQLRIERLRNITKKKPKVDLKSLNLTYKSNMARSFPGSEHRTSDEQARREKNTLAARVSRTKTKAYETMTQTQSVEAMCDNITLKRKIACLRVYAKELMAANGFPIPNLNDLWESKIRGALE